MRTMTAVSDVSGLRRHAAEEIRRFEERARAAGTANDDVTAARYALCASLDESALSTPWGGQSEWAQHNLLVAFHREAWGGEKFFALVDRVSADAGRHLELMEVLYLCLAFGFEGRYNVVDRGREQLADIRHELYRKIRAARGDAAPELSLRWRGLQDRRNPLVRYVPWWVVGAAGLAVLTIAFTLYYAWLGRLTEPVHAELAQVGLADFNRTTPVVNRGPTLKQLLAPEESRGLVQVEEDGGRTLVTLLAGTLFASGSATLGGEHQQTLGRVAAAIERVPGRVLVVGHTDDQPIQSFRYRDNFELSRERAVTVARLLQRGLSDAARIEWSGVGASQPRYTPASSAENRPRNRRVEIVHVAG
jgi:type VI secretion system protein ImpK